MNKVKHWPKSKTPTCSLERTHSNYRNSDVWYFVIKMKLGDNTITISIEDAIILGHELLKLVKLSQEYDLTQLKARLINYTDWTVEKYGKHNE